METETANLQPKTPSKVHKRDLKVFALQSNPKKISKKEDIDLCQTFKIPSFNDFCSSRNLLVNNKTGEMYTSDQF